jgi:SAM-dependent methyltransferase
MNERSRSDWDERSKAWTKTAPQGVAREDQFNQMIIEAAGIAPGEDVLDLASGTGNPAVSIALAMKGEGSVTCTDLTPRMLGAARDRAANLDIGIMRFVAADMGALPFADASFDAVTCRFAMHTTDNAAAPMREALRVLRPGGRFAVMVWGAYGDNPAFHVPRRTVAAFLNKPEGPAPGRHAYSAPGLLKGLLADAGFAHAEEAVAGYDNAVPDLDAYVANGLKRSYAKDTEGMDEARFAALKQAVMAAWSPYTRADGTTYVPNRAVLAIGRK